MCCIGSPFCFQLLVGPLIERSWSLRLRMESWLNIEQGGNTFFMTTSLYAKRELIGNNLDSTVKCGFFIVIGFWSSSPNCFRNDAVNRRNRCGASCKFYWTTSFDADSCILFNDLHVLFDRNSWVWTLRNWQTCGPPSQPRHGAAWSRNDWEIIKQLVRFLSIRVDHMSSSHVTVTYVGQDDRLVFLCYEVIIRNSTSANVVLPIWEQFMFEQSIYCANNFLVVNRFTPVALPFNNLMQVTQSTNLFFGSLLYLSVSTRCDWSI